MRTWSIPILLPFLLVCNPAVGYGRGKFTGTFMADFRPEGMMYLMLTQTQDVVTGSLMMVIPDAKGGTKSQTLSLQGVADRSTITLRANQLFEDLTISGRKQDEQIILMFPNDSGIISTVTFVPASESEFNMILKDWRQLLANTHEADQQIQRQKQQEEEKLRKLARILYDNVSAIKMTEVTGIKQDLMDVNYALNDERSALQQLENDLAELKRDASVHPMDCYQAYQTVAYDFHQTLGYDYNQTLGYANNQFLMGINRLEERLSRVNSMVARIKKEAHELDQAIKTSHFPLPRLSIMPGEELPVLNYYQSLAASARNELPSLKAENDKILGKAKEIIREGKTVMEKAQGLVVCR